MSSMERQVRNSQPESKEPFPKASKKELREHVKQVTKELGLKVEIVKALKDIDAQIKTKRKNRKRHKEDLVYAFELKHLENEKRRLKKLRGTVRKIAKGKFPTYYVLNYDKYHPGYEEYRRTQDSILGTVLRGTEHILLGESFPKTKAVHEKRKEVALSKKIRKEKPDKYDKARRELYGAEKAAVSKEGVTDIVKHVQSEMQIREPGTVRGVIDLDIPPNTHDTGPTQEPSAEDTVVSENEQAELEELPMSLEQAQKNLEDTVARFQLEEGYEPFESEEDALKAVRGALKKYLDIARTKDPEGYVYVLNRFRLAEESWKGVRASRQMEKREEEITTRVASQEWRIQQRAGQIAEAEMRGFKTQLEKEKTKAKKKMSVWKAILITLATFGAAAGGAKIVKETLAGLGGGPVSEEKLRGSEGANSESFSNFVTESPQEVSEAPVHEALPNEYLYPLNQEEAGSLTPDKVRRRNDALGGPEISEPLS